MLKLVFWEEKWKFEEWNSTFSVWYLSSMGYPVCVLFRKKEINTRKCFYNWACVSVEL